MTAGRDLAEADGRIAALHTQMPPIDPATGIPMEAALLIETIDHQPLVMTESYYAKSWIYDLLVVTDKDSYRFNELKGTMTTGDGEVAVAAQQRECQLAALDFLDAALTRREPAVAGRSVLPAMRVLERAQAEWDRRYGARSLPGRPLSTRSS